MCVHLHPTPLPSLGVHNTSTSSPPTTHPVHPSSTPLSIASHLVRPNIQSLVHLHGVSTDDLTMHLMGHMQRSSSLTHCSGPCNDYDFGLASTCSTLTCHWDVHKGTLTLLPGGWCGGGLRGVAIHGHGGGDRVVSSYSLYAR